MYATAIAQTGYRNLPLSMLDESSTNPRFAVANPSLAWARAKACFENKHSQTIQMPLPYRGRDI